MTGYVLTELRGGLVDIEITDRAAAGAVRAALLDAAESPRLIQTTTHRDRPGFRVPRAVAETAGLYAADDPEPVKAVPVKKAAVKKAPARAAAKKTGDPVVPDVVPEVEIGGTGPADSGGGGDVD